MANMAAHEIISGFDKTIDWDNIIRYSEPRMNQNTGAKSINISWMNNKKSGRLVITSPVLMTWGMSSYEGKSYDMNLQFPPRDTLPELQDVGQFLANLETFEAKLCRDAVEHSKKWFGKVMTKEQIEVLWSPMLRYRKDPQTGEPDVTQSPTWKVKFPYFENVFKCEIYNMDGELLYKPNDKRYADVDLEEIIQKKADVKLAAINGGIWFANGKFGVTWRLQQAAVEVKESMDGVCLLVGSKPSAAAEPVSVVVEDSDDEGESKTEEVEAEAEPVEAEAEPTEVKQTGVTQAKKKKVVKGK